MTRIHLLLIALLIGVALYVLVVGAAPIPATVLALGAVAIAADGRSRAHRAA